MPLRVETETAGPVHIWGTGVQGVEWMAAGRSAAVVPLLIYDDVPADGLVIHINDSETRLVPLALGPTDADPPDLAAFWQNVDPRPTAAPAYDDEAYALATLWQPGRSEATRRWTLTALGVVVLVFGVAAFADPKRATRWTVIAGIGLCAGIVWFFPSDSPRRVLAAEGRPGWEWIWRGADGSGQATVEEAWSPGLRFVPQSPVALAAARPVLVCDASGRPTAIRCRSAAGETSAASARLVFTRPRASSPSEPK